MDNPNTEPLQITITPELRDRITAEAIKRRRFRADVVRACIAYALMHFEDEDEAEAFEPHLRAAVGGADAD